MASETGLTIVSASDLSERREVGAGGFGTIFRARYHAWEMDVAVKFLHGTSESSSRDRELLREAEVMSSLRFPHIVSLVGLYHHPPEPLGIVMEFLEFGSLACLQQLQSLPPSLQVRLIHEVALGMNYLHGREPPLLHLDLNPRNILLDGELHAKIADFGLSKLKHIVSCESSSSIGGTLEYLPPECFNVQENLYKPGPPTDVYSFGVLIWSILTGKQPYGALNAVNRTLIKVLIPKNQRPDVRELPRQEAADKIDILEELMARCWHNEPGQRPAFKEVVMSTGAVLRAHRRKVLDAVHHVLSNLNRQPRDDVFEQPVFTRTLGPSAGIHQSTRKLLKEGKLGPSGLPGPVPSEGPMMAAWMPPLAEVRDKVVEHLRVGVNEDQAISATSLAEEKQSPPLSWMRQESGEGNLSYTTQRNLPKLSRWSSVKILLLESWMENMQIGSRNTMKVIQRGRRK